MKRFLILILLVAALGLGAWWLMREDGLVEQVTEARVESALLANGVPPELAECMAPKLTDRLSIAQLVRLERLAPEEGEEALPASGDEALERLRRVDDPQAVEALFVTAGRCGFELLIGGI